VRITEEAKKATRRRLLDAARALFTSQGFETAATRDIAHAAGTASGTLFNYFPSKEAIAVTLVSEALETAHADFLKRPRPTALEEQLFALIAAQLRRLKPSRSFVRAALETAATPVGETLRQGQLELVEELIVGAGLAARLSPIALQLYWTLYTGVLTFWASDASPHQEDTLALLDQSVNMLVSWFKEGGTPR
jgi:AcrR family transcriptional regulator